MIGVTERLLYLSLNVDGNQGDTIILKTAVNHAWDVPPFHYPLDICDFNALHELSELISARLGL